MATNGWGQGVENNTIEWGKGKDNATNNWGKVYETSASGDTLLEVATVPFSNTKSVDFDGVDDFVNMGDVLDFERTDAFSISLWFKRTRSGVSEFLVDKSESSGNYRGYFLLLANDDNLITFVLRSSNIHTQRFIVDGTTAITDTNWHHTVLTYDGSSATSGVKIYLDGSDDTGAVTGTLSATTVNSNPFQIGARNGGNTFSGKIDEVAVFNSELSASDVTAIYNSGTPLSLSSYNPISWWRMGDNDTYPTLTDNGSGGNNGTMTNMVSGDIVADVPPTFNKYSLSFDGVDDHVAIGATPSILQFDRLNTFSFCAWVKREGTSNQVIISNQLAPSTNYRGYYFDIQSDETLAVIFRSTLSDRLIFRSSSSLDLNWNHVVFTYDGGASTSSGQFYINGSADTTTGSGTLTGTAVSSDNLFLACRSNADNFLDGKLDEVAIFNTELSASDVTAIYNSGTPASLTSYSPLAWWRFEEGSGTTATDSGSGGNNGTITNGATYSTDKP